MFSSIAWAQEQAQAAGPSMWESLFPFALIFVVFYFVLIRPQQRRGKEQEATRAALKRGDSVLTTGGILGTIEGLTDSVVTLQIANGVKIKVLKSYIAGPAAEGLGK